MKIKVFLASVTAVLVGLSMVACSAKTSSSASSAATGKTVSTITIGMVTEAWDNPAIKDMADAAIAQAKSYPNVVILAQDSTNMQDEISKVQTLISRGVDALGIEPWDNKAIRPMLELAKTAKIPVFILQSSIPETDGTGLVTSAILGDEIAGGKIAGAWLGSVLKPGAKVAILQGALADTPGIQRADGFELGLKSANPTSTVVARQAADWARDKALQVTTDILTAHGDINAIFADNDEMAFGAVSALTSRKLNNKVSVVGYNGTCIGLQATYAGVFKADGVLFLDQVGKDFVDAAVKVHGGATVPTVIVPPITLLTTENIKKIHDGATSVDVNGVAFAVDNFLKARVEAAVAGKC